jgi:hypothetical protein
MNETEYEYQSEKFFSLFLAKIKNLIRPPPKIGDGVSARGSSIFSPNATRRPTSFVALKRY